jgi:hypothetical protein
MIIEDKQIIVSIAGGGNKFTGLVGVDLAGGLE